MDPSTSVRGRPHPRIAVAVVVLAVAGALAVSSASVVSAARGRPVVSSCAVPHDCRLFEAGEPVGVMVGLATSNGSDRHRATLLAEANLVVNHEFSWAGIEPDRGVWDFTKADANAQFARDNDLYQVAMHFAWDQALLDDLPGWVTAITDPDELRGVLARRAQVIFDRYPDIDRIDVINEPFLTLGSELYRNHFYEVLGPDYIAELFTIVEAEAPVGTELMVNEAGIEFQPDKADALVALVADLVASGHRVDAVGLQTHLSVGEPDWDLLLRTMQRLDSLGVAPFISEVDIPVPPTVPDRRTVQADRYRRVVEACLMVPSCDAVNVWGVSDADTWYDWALEPGLDPLLFDRDHEPKPAYFAVRDALLGGRIDPATRPARTAVPDATGRFEVDYAVECRSTSELTPSGVSLLSDVAHIFAAGNPLRLTIPARLAWNPEVGDGGAIRYEVETEVDLDAVAERYRDETARPAVGLGGYLELMDTVWLTLDATDLTLSYPHPPGAGPGSASPGIDATNVGVDPSAATLSIPSASGDSRAPSEPSRVGGSWSVTTAAATPTPALLGLPNLTMDLDVHLGVVVGGVPVDGGVAGTYTCATTGSVPTPSAAIGALAPPPTSGGSAPTAGVTMSRPAAAVGVLPSFAG